MLDQWWLMGTAFPCSVPKKLMRLGPDPLIDSTNSFLGWSPGAECSRIFDYCMGVANQIRREMGLKLWKMVPKFIKMMQKWAQDEPKRAKWAQDGPGWPKPDFWRQFWWVLKDLGATLGPRRAPCWSHFRTYFGPDFCIGFEGDWHRFGGSFWWLFSCFLVCFFF